VAPERLDRLSQDLEREGLFLMELAENCKRLAVNSENGSVRQGSVVLVERTE
jgi:hypothetical protein